MTLAKVVTLLELIRAFVNVFAESSYWLGFEFSAIYDQALNDDAVAVILMRLVNLQQECENLNLAISLELVGEAIEEVKRSQTTKEYPLLHETIRQLCDILKRELSQQLFVRINPERRKLYENPFGSWDTIIKRFGKVARDVEEMNKCFALSRYTAAMFHAMQIAEAGAIELGECINVTDSKKGWGATENQLAKIMKEGHANFPSNINVKFEFLEQMHREIATMTLAWRHKIDHAANRLAIIPNTDFTPDIAEHVMGAVRVFMLRLSEGIPH